MKEKNKKTENQSKKLKLYENEKIGPILVSPEGFSFIWVPKSVRERFFLGTGRYLRVSCGT